MAALDLSRDVVALTAQVCDVASVSGDERALADLVEDALRTLPHLRVDRDGDAVVARTSLDRADRVVLAGHLDTVPLVGGSLPTRLEDGVLHGRGTVDMKGGVAVALKLAAQLERPSRDVTYVFYDHEEVAASLNGLGRVARTHPEWLAGDFAILMEPSDGVVEGGCNGTLRAEVRTTGVTAHSARAWMGHNAIHDAAVVLERLRGYEPQTVEVDGLAYRESLNAVQVAGGIAGNVIPDLCVVTVNYRFAPAKSEDDAAAHVRQLFDGFDVTITDSAPGARPGLDHPAAAAFVAAVGGEPKPKYGWTDVARFAGLGVPAVNFGPGDPLLAHKDDERVPVEQLTACEASLLAWLQG
ncbi:succinyl-diaminopimelate desuccinylase [Motilibacter peucedani]|uniref:Succinyl-diaminopimelate desuccinylase n=1 Tax=Motilibacter peucedani TaxID=598650 RepID=A0A420XMG6_9ACTN|nr:succinyl-diaminopimelate desuccinylase [Motilibacter peucedani]RKS72435.1 succinyl-diaminopimelate desuccinylase [Motilibacter peucedani]